MQSNIGNSALVRQMSRLASAWENVKRATRQQSVSRNGRSSKRSHLLPPLLPLRSPRSGPKTVANSTSVFTCFEPIAGPCSGLMTQNSCAKDRSTPLDRLSKAIPCQVLTYLCLREQESFLTPQIAPASRSIDASTSLSLSESVKCIRLMLCLSFFEWRCIYPGKQMLLAPFLEKTQPWQSPRVACRLSVRPKSPKSRRALDDSFGPAAPPAPSVTTRSGNTTQSGGGRASPCRRVVLLENTPPRKKIPKSTHARRRPGGHAPSDKHELCDRKFTCPRRRPPNNTHASPSYPVRSPRTLRKPSSDTLEGPSKNPCQTPSKDPRKNPPLRAHGASLSGGRTKLRIPP